MLSHLAPRLVDPALSRVFFYSFYHALFRQATQNKVAASSPPKNQAVEQQPQQQSVHHHHHPLVRSSSGPASISLLGQNVTSHHAAMSWSSSQAQAPQQQKRLFGDFAPAAANTGYVTIFQQPRSTAVSVVAQSLLHSSSCVSCRVECVSPDPLPPFTHRHTAPSPALAAPTTPPTKA